MTSTSMTLPDRIGKLLRELHPDFLKDTILAVLAQVMEVEVSHLTGAEHGERSSERVNYRNGYRPRPWDTRLGQLELAIPRLRLGSYFPSFLEPRRRAEQALLAVIQEAYVHGVSTRKVEDLVQALGIPTLSKSEVSRVCQALDTQVEAFRSRPLTLAYPYLWLDAKYVKVRQDGRVVSQAIVTAFGVNAEGYREVLGLAVGASESEAFWREFLRQLVGRGLHGVKLVISDGHEGLKRAIAAVLTGAAWQRCIVHFLIEQHEEWQLGRRHLSEQSLADVLAPVAPLAAEPTVATPGNLSKVA